MKATTERYGGFEPRRVSDLGKGLVQDTKNNLNDRAMVWYEVVIAVIAEVIVIQTQRFIYICEGSFSRGLSRIFIFIFTYKVFCIQMLL